MSEWIKMLKVPWGVFDFRDPNSITKWRHNENIDMSADEQFLQNIKNGYLDDPGIAEEEKESL